MNQIARYVICEIDDKTFNPPYTQADIKDYHVRKAARGILIHKGKIALLNVSKRGYHKLPGGGIEGSETNEEGFIREILEETGCHGKIIDEGAITLEYRDQEKLVQISYIFIAEVVGEPGLQSLEQGEIEDGHDLEWYTIDEAEKVLTQGKPDGYMHRFIHLRDKEIFNFYKEKLKELSESIKI